MSRLLKIAIVGRPNVGKSALFNCICKKRKSIVDEREGVTRDRIYEQAEAFGKHFELIDTGGIDARSQELFAQEIRQQTEIAIVEADALIMVVDAKTGPQDLDRELATMLHKTKKPLCLAVNKIDNAQMMEQVHEFACLGVEPMIAVSCAHGFQIAELLEAVLCRLDATAEVPQETDTPKIAIIGRPNVGKSALLNALVGTNRCIVSAVAGTTRDSIDTPVTFDHHSYLFIDTAGIRKKHKEHEVVEKFASIRTTHAIERADICLLVMDAQQGVTAEEKKIFTMIEKAEKGCILLFNKWDLVKGIRMEHCHKALMEESPFVRYCSKLFISATTGRNLEKIFPTIQEVLKAYTTRVTTGALNKSLMQAMQKYHPPTIASGKRLRIYYMAQIDTAPPRFVLFVNSPRLMEESYKRYLINHLRDTFGFHGVPLMLMLRGKMGRTRKEFSKEEELSQT